MPLFSSMDRHLLLSHTIYPFLFSIGDVVKVSKTMYEKKFQYFFVSVSAGLDGTTTVALPSDVCFLCNEISLRKKKQIEVIPAHTNLLGAYSPRLFYHT